MSDEQTKRLAEIRERAKAATPAPWYLGQMEDGWQGIYAGDELVVGRVESEDVEDVEAKDNGEFIAHAREDVPYLLAMLEAHRVAAENLIKTAMAAAQCYTTLINEDDPAYNHASYCEGFSRGIEAVCDRIKGEIVERAGKARTEAA